MDRTLFDPQVGDWVRIRTWDDMAAEFGLNNSGNIACAGAFVDLMRPLEGLKFQITDISRGFYYGHGATWMISKDMLEPCECRGSEEDTEFEADTEALDSYLLSYHVV